MQKRLKLYWLAVITTLAAFTTLGSIWIPAYLIGAGILWLIAASVAVDYAIEVGPPSEDPTREDPTDDELEAVIVVSGLAADIDSTVARLLEHGRIAAVCRACDRFTITLEQPLPCRECGAEKERLDTAGAIEVAYARRRNVASVHATTEAALDGQPDTATTRVARASSIIEQAVRLAIAADDGSGSWSGEVDGEEIDVYSGREAAVWARDYGWVVPSPTSMLVVPGEPSYMPWKWAEYRDGEVSLTEI